jgi:hypothetical protein
MPNHTQTDVAATVEEATSIRHWHPYRTRSVDLVEREQALIGEAQRVMAALTLLGGEWQQAWKTHPVAVAYRALLREAWEGR